MSLSEYLLRVRRLRASHMTNESKPLIDIVNALVFFCSAVNFGYDVFRAPIFGLGYPCAHTSKATWLSSC